jgi:trigger factor
LNTTVEDITSTKKRLKIEIPLDIIEKEYKSSLNKVRQTAKIPGFRQGKVPVNLIEKKFGSNIKEDVLDRLVPDYYSKALKDAELVPVTMPTFESTLEIKRNEPLLFSLTVEVRPKISDFNYTGLKIDDIDTHLDDKEIEDTIKMIQEQKAMFDVVDREIKTDDLLVIDYVKLDETGEKELSSNKDQVMNLGSNIAPKGILEAVVGKRKGDVVELDLPSFEGNVEGVVTEEKTGKGNLIRITIKEVKEKRLPEIDDEFAKDFGHESLEILRKKINEGLIITKKENAAKKQKEKLHDFLVESHDFDIPESLIERQLRNLVINKKLADKQSNELTADAKAGAVSENIDDSGLAEKLRPQAMKNAKSAILLDMIAEKEGITVTEEELKARIVLLAQQFQATPEAVINFFVTKDGSLENLKYELRDEKVLDVVLSKAEIIKGE